MGRIGRRRFLAAANALLVAPQLAWAQQSKGTPENPARIGFLLSASEKATAGFRKAFFAGLAERGWIEGKNLVVDIRYVEGKMELHDRLARELLALKPDLIVAPVLPGVLAVRKLTTTVPIVFVIVGDPVASGIAQSLARPGGNATGLSDLSFNLVEKRISVLIETIPSSKRVALMEDPKGDANGGAGRVLAEQAAKTLGVSLEAIELSTPETFDAAFSALERMRPDAAVVFATPRTFIHRAEIVRRMNAAKIAAMYSLEPFVRAGGLMSYAVNFPDQFRRSAEYVDRILRGAAPGDLPIEQPTKFDLVVNLKTAKLLDITVPQSILLRADRVIE